MVVGSCKTDACIRHQAHGTAIGNHGGLISAVAVAVLGGYDLLGNISVL